MKDGFEITADEVKARLRSGEKLFFVNLRHYRDWDLAVMQARGALRIPDNKVEEHLEEIPKDRTVVVYSTCPGDEPSIQAAQFLRQRGWHEVHPLVGGFKAYLCAGLPTEELGEGSATRRLMLL